MFDLFIAHFFEILVVAVISACAYIFISKQQQPSAAATTTTSTTTTIVNTNKSLAQPNATPTSTSSAPTVVAQKNIDKLSNGATTTSPPDSKKATAPSPTVSAAASVVENRREEVVKGKSSPSTPTETQNEKPRRPTAPIMKSPVSSVTAGTTTSTTKPTASKTTSYETTDKITTPAPVTATTTTAASIPKVPLGIIGERLKHRISAIDRQPVSNGKQTLTMGKKSSMITPRRPKTRTNEALKKAIDEADSEISIAQGIDIPLTIKQPHRETEKEESTPKPKKPLSQILGKSAMGNSIMAAISLQALTSAKSKLKKKSSNTSSKEEEVASHNQEPETFEFKNEYD